MALQLPGTGPHRFWGFSPSYDVRNPECTAGPPSHSDAKFTCLLICPGDVRHVIHTLANSRASENSGLCELNFHVYEEHPEQLARHMLLLSIALDFELPRRERAEIFLEVMGNTTIRERTALYVAARARELRTLLAHESGPLAGSIDLSALKMKERDAIDVVLATYLENVEFDVERLRDERLRSYYKDRYDVRRNVLDWDYSMGLVETAPNIHRVHFREWRMTGMAYEVRDAAYNTPNRSLASAAAGRQKGASVLKRGFWGDVVNTPYGAVGVECNDQRFFAKKSDQIVKTACDVAYYNVVGWLTQLETGRPFVLRAEDFDDFEYGASVGSAGLVKGFLRSDQAGPRPREQIGSIFEEITEEEEEGAAAKAEAGGQQDVAKLALDAAADEERARRQVALRRRAQLPRFSLALHTGRPLDLFHRCARLQGRCAHVHVASHAAHLLAAPMTALLTERAVIAVESARFLCEVHKEAKKRLATKLVELGQRAGLQPAKPLDAIDGQHDSLVCFSFERAHEEARRAAALEQYGPLLSAQTEPAAGAPQAEEAADASVEQAGALLHGSRLDGAPAADGGALEAAPAAEEGAVVRAKQPAAALTAAVPTRGPDAIGTPAARVCAITGLPAKYRDPKTGSYYANAEAFKELRRRHAAECAPASDGAPSASSSEAAGADASASPAAAAEQPPEEDDVIRPRRPPLVVSSGGVTRRLNKVA